PPRDLFPPRPNQAKERTPRALLDHGVTTSMSECQGGTGKSSLFRRNEIKPLRFDSRVVVVKEAGSGVKQKIGSSRNPRTCDHSDGAAGREARKRERRLGCAGASDRAGLAKSGLVRLHTLT